MHAPALTRVPEHSAALAPVPLNCTSCAIILCAESEEFSLWIRDEKNVNSDSRGAGGGLNQFFLHLLRVSSGLLPFLFLCFYTD